MLLADKRDLQNQLKLSVLRIDEKELDLYTTNCNTVCVEASLLAGFAFTALIEKSKPAPQDTDATYRHGHGRTDFAQMYITGCI